jgi:hypothetical protein
VRLGRSADRLVELGERKGREQLIAARALLFRDGDGREEGLFSGRRVRGIALEQDIAADAEEQGVGPMLSRLIGERQRVVDPAQGSVRVVPFAFELGEPTLEERHMQPVSLVDVCGQGAS